MKRNIGLLVGCLCLIALFSACSSQEEPTMMCPSCEEEISCDSNFCQWCGAPAEEFDSADDSEAAEQTGKDRDVKLSDNSDQSQTVIEYEFLDHTDFTDYWYDGIFRCGTDFEAGEYYILPLYGAGAQYDVSDSPNDFTWSKVRLIRKVVVQEGQYVKVDHDAIMVLSDEVDTSDWNKYGVFLVGRDLPAGDYKIETISNSYESDLASVFGISGAYQINDGDVDGDLLESDRLVESQSYITLEDGQYIVIVNARLTNIETE